MTPDLETLARRAVAAPGWRWMPGMLTLSDKNERSYRFVDDRLIQESGRRLREPKPWLRELLPNLTDPATLGCLLHLVREAWGDPEVHVTRAGPAPWVCWMRSDDSGDGWMAIDTGRTEAEALVAALVAR